ncbi:33 kDa chaperonin [Vibrio stylophorae]|uniref:33 kDa chaperonin n=1 Tax=Vibrio stylophorae TaxID=659351 RepID=A0ABM8ZPV5_9VIBR|nr:Hsp33 family molecular chaperone HslO [Vibrio stylophorae]CAH0532333.1 33 kDa chaperonin [Vibrio stylophorae]
MAKDNLYRYLFESLSVRGELVQLNETFAKMQENKQYPAPVQTLLGELLVATSLLTATLKFEGSIAVQIQGDGPVSLAVINGDHEQKLRGVARHADEVPNSNRIQDLVGNGHMVITITPNKGERYQGIVALEGDTLAACLENYFAQSEQLATKLVMRTDAQHAAGMLLQALPDTNENAAADFEHLATLTETVKAEELFSLDAEEVLYRLYHQEEVKLFEPQPVSFECGCSRERCEGAILNVGREEIELVISEQGSVVMNCDYCGAQYDFDNVDVAALFENAMKGDSQQH